MKHATTILAAILLPPCSRLRQRRQRRPARRLSGVGSVLVSVTPSVPLVATSAQASRPDDAAVAALPYNAASSTFHTATTSPPAPSA